MNIVILYDFQPKIRTAFLEGETNGPRDDLRFDQPQRRAVMAADRLYFVAECPASPGFGGVVVLHSTTSARLVFFAPCCGIAWREAPLDGRLDASTRLEDLEPGGVQLLSRAEIQSRARELMIIRDEPTDNWIADIPGLQRGD